MQFTAGSQEKLPQIVYWLMGSLASVKFDRLLLVLLAAALTQSPAFLILDEPTAHLDFGNAHRFLGLVLRLHAQGIGILMTTHFPDHALYLAAETLVLKDKTLWKHGAAAEVIDEAGMSALYGLPVHIAQIGTRTVCVGVGYCVKNSR